MKIIRFQGLNCFEECVISIANHLGTDYPVSFATLWSETDFRYDQYRKAYLSKRMISNLESLGAKVKCFDCFSSEDVAERVFMFRDSEFIIVGMDAFYIPWNQFYQTFHGPHYFIVKNEEKALLNCIDPTYERGKEQIPYENVINHTFDIGHVRAVEKKSIRLQEINEAQEVVTTHPNTCKELLWRIHNCVNQEQDDIILLAKYVDTMICNRYLYRFFLQSQSSKWGERSLLFNDDYFLEWKAVKNGLYKVSVCKNKEDIISDVCNHFNYLIDVELEFANRILNSQIS